MEIRISEKYDGKTVLSYLKDNGFSHTLISRMKRVPNGIMRNGEHVTVRAILCVGDVLSLSYEDNSDDVNLHIEPTPLDIDVVYEDEDLVVVNKPFGMPTIPSHNHQGDTLANALAYRYRDQNFVFRTVNRLDKNTSGLVLVARDPHAATELYRQMQAKLIKKSYTAILYGRIDPPNGEIRSYIKRERESIIKRINLENFEEGAQFAHTTYKTQRVIEGSKGIFSMVSASPLTGRTHQLRVHFAGMGNPICADDLYGRDNEFVSIGRQALHASTLEFIHPTTKENVFFTADLPADMVNLLKELNDLEES